MTVAAQAKLQSPAALAHERIYESVYVVHLRKASHVTSIGLIASYSEAENLDIQQHVQSELKEILRSFHESMFRSPLAKNYMAALRTSLDNHAAECLTFCCRAAGICKDMKKARKKAMGSKAKEEALQKGEIARSMSDILRLRSNEYAIKAAQKHARRCLRTCQKRYVKRCSSFLQFTRVWDDMLREISVPVVDAMCRTIEAELLQHDGFAGSDNGASIFEDARMHAEADFEKAVREWGISRTFGEAKLEKVIAGAEQTTAPASNGVDDHLKKFIFCLLNTTMRREKKRLKPQLKLAREHLFQNQRVAKYRQNESERAARLTVDNDVLLYQINPQSGKRIMPSTRRAETDVNMIYSMLFRIFEKSSPHTNAHAICATDWPLFYCFVGRYVARTAWGWWFDWRRRSLRRRGRRRSSSCAVAGQGTGLGSHRSSGYVTKGPQRCSTVLRSRRRNFPRSYPRLRQGDT